MTDTPTDPVHWFLASQALDQRDTAAVINAALIEADDDTVLNVTTRENLADDLAIELARAGYAVVKTVPTHGERPVDLSSFLSRKED